MIRALKNKTNNRVLLVVLLILICALGASCSSGDPKKDEKKSSSGLLDVPTDDDAKVTFDSSKLETLPNSGAGANAFAYHVASYFVSTDVKQKDILQKLTASNGSFSIDGILERNNSESLSRITFSPIGLVQDSFGGNEASVAVIGMSFESSSQVVSSWKEISLNLVFEGSWKVQSFNIGIVSGPPGNNTAMTAEQAVVWSSYIFPEDGLSPGEKTLLDYVSQDLTSVDENGVPLTFPGE